jgi:hypothetical protein
VLVELSPLETALREAPSGADVVTAVWLVRRAERFQVTFVTAPQETASNNTATGVGPIEVEFSPDDHEFTVRMDGAWKPILQSGLPAVFVKTFFIVVDLLRGLSSTVKPDPYALAGSGSSKGMRVLVPVRRASTVLTRAKADPLDLRLHFLRNAGSLQPFNGPGFELASLGLLTLELADSFAALPTVHDVYGSASQVTLDGIEVAVPAREGVAPSAAVAEFVEKLFSGEVAGVQTGL